MAELELDLDPVDTITVGVEGEPGHRTFYLEARQGRRSCTLVVEKVQLAELGAQLLSVMEDQEGIAVPAPDATTGPLDPPGWRVGSIQISMDDPGGSCTLLLEELADPAQEAEEVALEPERRQVRLVASLGQMRGLAERCLRVVEGGRPICPLCQLPMDATGHVCPARNGHHPT